MKKILLITFTFHWRFFFWFSVVLIFIKKICAKPNNDEKKTDTQPTEDEEKLSSRCSKPRNEHE